MVKEASLWENTCHIKNRPSLDKSLKTQVLIIGAGITGILTARFLQDEGMDVIVVDAGRIGKGATGNTTAKITSQHGLIYQKLIKSKDVDTAKLYLEANEKAIRAFEELSENIDCDFMRCSNYIYSVNNRGSIETEVNILNNRLSFNAKFHEKIELPFAILGAIEFPNQGQFHPLKFLNGISDGIKIFEGTPIYNVKGNKAYGKEHIIEAENIIFACQFPFLDRAGLYYIKMYQQHSYVIAGTCGETFKGMYAEAESNGISIRNYKDITILGGPSVRTGKTAPGWDYLNKVARKLYPSWKTKYYWSNQDCITLDDIAYVGVYSRNKPNMLVATGYNKWGMTGSMVAAQILRDEVLQKENPYKNIFASTRSIMHLQTLNNGLETAKNLLTPTIPRCTHLGCALKNNVEEGTWDCSCHGSKFDMNGNVLRGPANKGL